MGVTKQYLRYAATGVFGVVASSKANLVMLEYGGLHGRLCAVPACEHVFIWDLRKAEKVLTLEGDKHEVTCLANCPDKSHLAVGYNDGSIRVFDLASGDLSVTFSGHKSAITALNYDKDGVRLVSGAKDTDVIVWDIINESGLYRLKGHQGMVTQARFLHKTNILITSSKDTYVKFWDLDTQHCFKTLVGHKTEVWGFVLAREDTLLITGSVDSDLRLWQITLGQDPDAPTAKKPKVETSGDEGGEDLSEDEDEEAANILTCTKLGSVMRHGKDRVVSMATDPTGRVLGCHGNDNQLEVFKINTEAEAKKHLHKLQKKARRKLKESGEAGGEDVQVPASSEDHLRRMSAVRVSSKLRSFSCLMEQENLVKFICLLNNNTLESCHLDISDKKSSVTDVSKLSLPAHRSDVRTVCFSSENTAILSGSGEALKMWNRATLQCIRTMPCDYALCSLFAPGDRHVVIGTKTGKLQIFDIAAGTLLESVDAHDGAVWSISMAPDKRGLVSGSADHEVKFWDFELVSDEEYSATKKRLTLVHTRTLKMTEDVLCVKFSPDGRLLAVSLLDNTVKVFFADTLKFFLSLYGHKLPVLCMDISSDSNLLVTGSADRNVKLWGLDFGDCHKSIFAHDDSIMCVQFVPKTHHFWTGGKDRKLKQWDGDTFENIITLEGHHGEVWSLAVSPSGNFVVTASHDKSLRLWEKTDEPLVLGEEREMEREKEYEESVAQGEEPVVAGEAGGEAQIAGKKTIETVKAAERLMEALDLYKEETAKEQQRQLEAKQANKQVALAPLHPMFQAFKVDTPAKYVLEVVKKVKSSELEEALLVLPFSYVVSLLHLLDEYVSRGWQVELVCRCMFFLLRIHQGAITSNEVLLPVMERLKDNTSTAVNKLRDTIGFNLAGLHFLQRQIEEKEHVRFFADATEEIKQKKKKAKKRAILTIKT